MNAPYARAAAKVAADGTLLSVIKRTFNACVVASDALHARPGGGQDLTRLRFADVQAVFSAMSCIRCSDNGELASRKWRMDSFSVSST
ncbi:hypothetical protein [Streptomyces sp. NPDC057557]|uniref:hypothetical protein n=1 Tax=Streptomyces sp. NPDC057557 TaxID=3346167 RepID=UPI00367B6FF2